MSEPDPPSLHTADGPAAEPGVKPVTEPGAENASPEGRRCGLCGLPARRSPAVLTVEGEVLHFCCQGCLHVFQVLFNSPDGSPVDYKQTELYRACVASGLIPSGEETPDDFELGVEAVDERMTRELTLDVSGMWCSACSWIIEETLRKKEGILGASVLFLSDLVRIKYLPHRIGAEEIIALLGRLGYRASLPDGGACDSEGEKELVPRLGITAILAFNTMMISFALYCGFFQDLGKDGVKFLSYPLLLLSTPAVFYGGRPIIRRAWLGLRSGSATMDALIATGSLAAYFYSVEGLLRGSLHLYFDTASMLVTLVLLGRFIELRARENVSGGLAELRRMALGKVRLRGSGGGTRWVTPEAVEPGDVFAASAGERVSIDGRILSGRGAVDESLLTGETRPRKRGPGDDIPAGVLVLDGELELRAVRAGTESALNRIVAMIEEALSMKNPMELLADRITRRLAPLIFAIALCTGLFLRLHGLSTEAALLRAITVLVITCPCALGIATPLAKVAALGVARSLGILIRDPSALETAKNLDAIVFDKTGTLTEGNFALRDIVVASGGSGRSEKEALRLVASVETGSDHFLAKEIVRKAAAAGLEPMAVTGCASLEGMGVKGSVGKTEIAVGNRKLMDREGLSLPSGIDRRAGGLEAQGATVVWFGWEGEARGFLAFRDEVKATAAEVVATLREKGIEVRLVSGDSRETTRAVAEKLGVEWFEGQAAPEDKARIVKDLQAAGRRVGMVGDGVNDAPALAQADVGFAVGLASNLVRDASDIALLGDDPRSVLEVLDLAVFSSRIIRRNLFFAFFYNILGIPLAISGFLNPMVAALAMFASSATVVGNTLRILKRAPAGREIRDGATPSFGSPPPGGRD